MTVAAGTAMLLWLLQLQLLPALRAVVAALWRTGLRFLLAEGSGDPAAARCCSKEAPVCWLLSLAAAWTATISLEPFCLLPLWLLL